MAYAERRVAPGTDVWASCAASGEQRILPDGCLDLLWDGAHLLVAGPDPVARVLEGDGSPMTGVRLHGGRGPALLGVPADELTGRTLPLADLWGERRARALAHQVAADPASGLGEWAVGAEPDPFGDRLLVLLGGGLDVGVVADRLGFSARQVQRRAHAAFGYGPQHLARVLRLQRALALGDRGVAWAGVAPAVGYTDQAHLTRDVRALAGTTPGALRAERVRSVQDAA